MKRKKVSCAVSDLKYLLRKAYEEGFSGPLELRDSVVEALISESKLLLEEREVKNKVNLSDGAYANTNVYGAYTNTNVYAHHYTSPYNTTLTMASNVYATPLLNNEFYRNYTSYTQPALDNSDI